jgi:hypothetical protein
LREREPVDGAGQMRVGDESQKRPTRQKAQRLVGALGPEHRETRRLQMGHDRFALMRLLLDDENRGSVETGAHGRASSTSTAFQSNAAAPGRVTVLSMTWGPINHLLTIRVDSPVPGTWGPGARTTRTITERLALSVSVARRLTIQLCPSYSAETPSDPPIGNARLANPCMILPGGFTLIPPLDARTDGSRAH